MKIKNSKGLTLIELLISISILSIIGLAFFSTINTSININKKNETDIKAMHLAQSEVENLRSQIKKSTSSTLDIVDLKGKEVRILKDGEEPKEDEKGYTLDDYYVERKVIEKDKENLLYEISVTVFESNENFSNKDTKLITLVVKGRG